MKQTTAGRFFFGFLILVAPAALSFVNAIAGWAVLALVAGALVARKRRSSLDRPRTPNFAAADPSTPVNA